MKKAVKSVLTLVLAITVLMLPLTRGLAVRAPGEINYVAFGDSIAAGVRGGVGAPGSELRSDRGYTDDIAGLLLNAGVLGSFDKSYCVSGMTAKALARNTAGLKDTSSSGALLVKNADIVTLDIGANDLLGPFYAYAASLNSVMDFDLGKASQILNRMIDDLYNGALGTDVQKNIETILRNILTANVNAKIFVMGLYNPLPVVSALLGMDLNTPTQYFNTLVQKAIADVQAEYPMAGLSFVATFDAMSSSEGSLVMTDIHPTEDGYMVIADEFWKQIKPLADACRTDAAVSASRFRVNGRAVAFGAYIIDNCNYVKLRDIAMALNATSKQISVVWDPGEDTVTVTSGNPYTPVGGELTPLGDAGIAQALLSRSAIVLDGYTLYLTAYNIGGNNYIRLRDLTSALNIGVTWDDVTNTVGIET